MHVSREQFIDCVDLRVEQSSETKKNTEKDLSKSEYHNFYA